MILAIEASFNGTRENSFLAALKMRFAYLMANGKTYPLASSSLLSVQMINDNNYYDRLSYDTVSLYTPHERMQVKSLNIL